MCCGFGSAQRIDNNTVTLNWIFCATPRAMWILAYSTRAQMPTAIASAFSLSLFLFLYFLLLSLSTVASAYAYADIRQRPV